MDDPQVLLAHHLKALRLPTFLREYDKLARQCTAEGVDHSRYLLRLAELEMIDLERRTVERRIKEARFERSKVVPRPLTDPQRGRDHKIAPIHSGAPWESCFGSGAPSRPRMWIELGLNVVLAGGSLLIYLRSTMMSMWRPA